MLDECLSAAGVLLDDPGVSGYPPGCEDDDDADEEEEEEDAEL